MTGRELRLIHPSSLALGPAHLARTVRYEGAIVDGSLEARMTVRSQLPPFANAEIPLGSPQWGLWDWDVVEIFLRPKPSGPYYEFQLSPLGQSFELKVIEPRRAIDRDFRSGWSGAVDTLSECSWSARFRIPLSTLGWAGDPAAVDGGAFAILGNPPQRGYWALHLPVQEQPDFHLPHYFGPLV